MPACRHWLWLALLAAPARAADAPVPARVEFNRDVRPILSDACSACHGPDAKKRKGELRLDAEADARKAFVAGHPDESPAWQRVADDDPSRRMPPPSATRQLTAREKAVLKRWIEQGARWQAHWAFLAPKRPSVPAGGEANPIDAFVRERLDAEGLKPNPPADRVTLTRRAALDLTGLPPSPDEVDRFLDDASPDAYERYVDRLLASAAFGERMAVRWLDAARYADTSGYQNDGERSMWRWRDWVIEAYNHNMPFDQFTVEQLAGDLLPGATPDQVLATGFNRNHRGNAEGGIIPEEYAAEYVADRVETTATVWLGLTMTCARCHDHKYDPIATLDFYRLFAYFNNVPERGKAVKYGNSPPLLVTPTRWQRARLMALDEGVAEAKAALKALEPKAARTQSDWERALPRGAKSPDAPEPGLGVRLLREPAGFDGKRSVSAGDVGKYGFYSRFTLSMWVNPRSLDGVLVSRAKDVPQGEGYSVTLAKGRVGVNLVKRWLDDAIRIETVTALKADRWTHVAVSYDGSRWASGVTVYLDGEAAALDVPLDELNQTFETAEPLRLGAGLGARLDGQLRDVRVYDRATTAEQALALAEPKDVAEIARIPAGKRTPGQAAKLRAHFVATGAGEDVRDAHRRLGEREAERQAFYESLPTTMVMKEGPPKPTHVLIRGEYDRRGIRVTPGTPKALPRRDGAKADRLALARWLVDEANPLTARVAVNRLWQQVFGVGLVKTGEDFGVQGEWPSHPELLDWLAVEFRESGWDVKRLLRLIATSATYRRSSRVTAESLRRDPENRSLSRSPRLRLPAEAIRDQALAASGLMVARLGGPSVKPYQPAGLWNELADMNYQRDSGDALYRRGLYTYWKRTVPPPGATTFDAGMREACNVREARTNTPLQALNLLNDVTYAEAARVLAARAMQGARGEPERLALLFRLVLARRPAAREMEVLRAALGRHRAHFVANRAEAERATKAGEAARVSLDVTEQAAYAAVAAVVLNLDEAVTRE